MSSMDSSSGGVLGLDNVSESEVFSVDAVGIGSELVLLLLCDEGWEAGQR